MLRGFKKIPKTTEIYLHSIGNIEKDAMAAFEGAEEKFLTGSQWVIKKEG
jgi:hypothetical protein